MACKTRLNHIFEKMKERCFYKKDIHYSNYGGRGITVCDEWNTPNSHEGWKRFKKWALENGYNDTLTIDRIDNNKGYSPDNCRWVTPKVQSNNRRTNRYITYKGQTKTVAEWCDILNLDYYKVKQRLNRDHWSVEKAFEIKCDARLKLVTYKGRTQYLAEWCRELNLNPKKVYRRINKSHWSIEKAFETP